MSELHVGATPREMIPGDPEMVAGLAAQLGVLATGLWNAGVELHVIQVGDWLGPAAESFDSVRDQQPEVYGVVSAAFTAASSALTGYAAVLAAAQDQARLAIDMFEEAAAATARWERQVVDYRDLERSAEWGDPVATDRLDSLDRPPLNDPGGHQRAEAELLLADARAWVDTAGTDAAGLLDGAAEDAPDEPSLVERAWDAAWLMAREYWGGVYDSTVGLGQFLWSVSTVRLITDPDGWAQTTTQVLEGLEYGAEHPVEILQAFVDWDTWMESPPRALGHLLPGIVLTVVTAGAGGAATTAGQVLQALNRIQTVATVVERLSEEAAEATSEAMTANRVADGVRHPFETVDLRDLPGLRPDDLRVAAAFDPTVDVDAIAPAPVWRASHEPLYRADDRGPEVIFEDGFAPRDPSNVDLAGFVGANTPSAFVSTTMSPTLIVEWQTAYWYTIDAPGGIDVNATLGAHPSAHELEIAFPGGIDEGSIVGVQTYDAATGQLGPLVANPNYDPIP